MTFRAVFLLSSFCPFNAIILALLMIAATINASNCNEPCQNQDDCAGELICINGKCNDLQGATPTCSKSSRAGAQSCDSRGPHSPAIIPSGTPALLTLDDFGAGGDGGVPPKCDDKYHPLPERVVALSTGWFDNRSRCGKMIRIEAGNGKSVVAKVVHECDSVHGCDKPHGYQPPCKTNVVVASETVWHDLELDMDKGEAAVTWSMAHSNDSADD